MKANCAAFSSYVSALYFLAPKFCEKNALVNVKPLMILTPDGVELRVFRLMSGQEWKC